MEPTIKRNSKGFLILFFVSLCILIAAIVATIIESIMNFVFVLMGFGFLLHILSTSETDAKSSKLLSICSDVFWSAMCFGLYFYFRSSGSTLTAKFFVLFGIFLVFMIIYSIISIQRRRIQHE